jgi:hypothetical protein
MVIYLRFFYPLMGFHKPNQGELERNTHTEEVASTIGDVGPVGGLPTTLDKLQAQLTKTGKDRNLHLRKEQLSQGVLGALLQSLGRLLLEQVNTRLLLGHQTTCHPNTQQNTRCTNKTYTGPYCGD